ncbi:hypothetical protein BJ170DRAFT_613966 [Xylariales sp. AK1849]|nr:hypothetical protein BJ170DRAFT_613966 [Xylariales sp. AK1849]
MYPCNQTSAPGFLEHLPYLFQDVNVAGRFALRWAVRAAAYADASKASNREQLMQKALHCYGMALSALGQSLSQAGKSPDDHDLMTVVVLDIFETLFIPDSARAGAHAQGMAQILRLRGSDQVYNPRGWSLFRLAHHRVQKQQLAFDMPTLPESQEWLDQLNDNVPFVRLEKDAFQIKKTCETAQKLLGIISNQTQPVATIVEIVQEMMILDEATSGWRQTSDWSFATLQVSAIPLLESSARPLTETVELHADVWNAYEWNYHRTARIILRQKLLKCLEAAQESVASDISAAVIIDSMIQQSRGVIHQLADEVLATVPQSFGDIDHLGRVHNDLNSPPKCRAIGGYLLLWPVKIIKAPTSSTTQAQKGKAQVVFERIREYTGMKSELGDRSSI